jgi:hypothetical protein
MDKQKQREEIQRQLMEFMLKGGKVEKLKGKKTPVQRKVTA